MFRKKLSFRDVQHGYEVVPVLHDAIDMLDLELEAK